MRKNKFSLGKKAQTFTPYTIAQASSTGIASGASHAGREVKGTVEGNRGHLILILAIIVFIFDVSLDYKGFYIESLNIWGVVDLIKAFGFLLPFAIVFFITQLRDLDLTKIASYAAVFIALLVTFSYIIKYDPLLFYHFIFIIAFWMLFLRQQENATNANIILIVVIFFDFYTYSAVKAFLPAFGTLHQLVEGLPFLFFLTLFYVWDKTNSTFFWCSFIYSLIKESIFSI